MVELVVVVLAASEVARRHAIATTEVKQLVKFIRRPMVPSAAVQGIVRNDFLGLYSLPSMLEDKRSDYIGSVLFCCPTSVGGSVLKHAAHFS